MSIFPNPSKKNSINSILAVVVYYKEKIFTYFCRLVFYACLLVFSQLSSNFPLNFIVLIACSYRIVLKYRDNQLPPVNDFIGLT